MRAQISHRDYRAPIEGTWHAAEMVKDIAAADDARMHAKLTAAAKRPRSVLLTTHVQVIEATRATIAHSHRLLERARAPYLMINEKSKHKKNE